MGSTLVMVTLLLGAACPVQLPSSHPILNSTQNSHDSYLISCTYALPEERVAQVHWKERHPDGKYSVIAVLNPVWGNVTQPSYQQIVILSKKDDTTYTLEIEEAAGKEVCCEVLTYPSGIIQEDCLVVESNSVPASGGDYMESALLGALLVSGFFVFGSIVLICHICWNRKKSRLILNARGANQEAWNRGQRSRVPYSRTPPSVNLAYEPAIEEDLFNNEAAQRTHIHPPTPGNQLLLEGLPARTQRYHEIPPSRNQQLSEDPPSYTNPPAVPPTRIHAIPENSSTGNQIYSNVRRHRARIGPIGEQQPGTLTYGHSTGNPYHMTCSPWLSGETTYFSEDTSPLPPPRLRVPRTPDSAFTTVNPMYHSHPAWAPLPSNAHVQYQQTALS